MSANKPKLTVIDGGIDSDSFLSLPNQETDQDNEKGELKIVHDSEALKTIQEVREKMQFLEQMLATIDQKTDAELYEYMKKLDGSHLDGHHVGDVYPNSPHPIVIKRESDGRLVYHDPDNALHHNQLLSVRLICIATSRRDHYREWLKGEKADE